MRHLLTFLLLAALVPVAAAEETCTSERETETTTTTRDDGSVETTRRVDDSFACTDRRGVDVAHGDLRVGAGTVVSRGETWEHDRWTREDPDGGGEHRTTFAYETWSSSFAGAEAEAGGERVAAGRACHGTERWREDTEGRDEPDGRWRDHDNMTGSRSFGCEHGVRHGDAFVGQRSVRQEEEAWWLVLEGEGNHYDITGDQVFSSSTSDGLHAPGASAEWAERCEGTRRYEGGASERHERCRRGAFVEGAGHAVFAGASAEDGGPCAVTSAECPPWHDEVVVDGETVVRVPGRPPPRV